MYRCRYTGILQSYYMNVANVLHSRDSSFFALGRRSPHIDIYL